MGNPAVERRADVYGAVSQVEQAQAALHRARSRIDQIDSKLRDTRSVAPFAGVIVEKYVEVGDTVQPGQPLLRIADDRRLQIRVDVPARLIEGLRVGMVVQARLDVGRQLVEARVARIYPMADPQRHTVTVKLDLQPGSGGRPGMYAEVIAPDISVPRSTLPWVPESAVQWRGSLPAVFVATDEGRTELRMIRVGERWDSGYTVLSGLRIGERIVAAPPPGMVSGWGSKSEK
jgi:RND family efflux transporter MFP subunit